MSGGSFDYVCYDISVMVYEVEDDRLQIALINLYEALHVLEWVVSGDWGPDTMKEPIELALKTPIEDYKGFGELCKRETFNKLKDVVEHAKRCDGLEYEFAKHVFQILKAIHERRI